MINSSSLLRLASFVTEGMDEGPVVAQSVVPVLIDDTAETLAARVLTRKAARVT